MELQKKNEVYYFIIQIQNWNENLSIAEKFI